MRNKYLEEIGIYNYSHRYSFPYNVIEYIKCIPNRIRNWKQRRMYGGYCCSSNCWSLDNTSVEWLYCNLKQYLKDADEIVDLSYYKFEWNGKKYTQKEAVEYIIDKCKQYLIHCNKPLDSEYGALLQEKYFDGRIELSKDKEQRLTELHNQHRKEEERVREELQEAIRLYAEIIFACWW